MADFARVQIELALHFYGSSVLRRPSKVALAAMLNAVDLLNYSVRERRTFKATLEKRAGTDARSDGVAAAREGLRDVFDRRSGDVLGRAAAARATASYGFGTDKSVSTSRDVLPIRRRLPSRPPCAPPLPRPWRRVWPRGSPGTQRPPPRLRTTLPSPPGMQDPPRLWWASATLRQCCGRPPWPPTTALCLRRAEHALCVLNPLRGLAFDPIGLSYLLPLVGWEFHQPSAPSTKSRKCSYRCFNWVKPVQFAQL